MAIYTLEEFKAKIARWQQNAPKVLEKHIRAAALQIVAYVQTRKLTGQVLRIRTGTLRRSQTEKVSVTPGEIKASIGTNVWYGKLLETGTAINPQGGMATLGRRAKRPFLRPSVDENKKMFMQEVLNGMMEAYQNG